MFRYTDGTFSVANTVLVLLTSRQGEKKLQLEYVLAYRN